MNFTELQLDILFKLWRNRCFRRNATLQIDTVVTAAPSHLIGRMRDELDDRIRKGNIIKIPHRHKEKVFINPHYLFEIESANKKLIHSYRNSQKRFTDCYRQGSNPFRLLRALR